MKKTQLGLSLIEASMVLALAAVIVAGVMFYYQSASDNNKEQETVSLLMSISGYISGIYGQNYGSTDFAGVNDVVYLSSVVPQQYKKEDKSMISPFGGTLSVKPYTDMYGLKGYAIYLNKVPRSQCVPLLLAQYNDSLESIVINSTVIFKKYSHGKVPATANQIADLCNKSPTNITIAYEYVMQEE